MENINEYSYEKILKEPGLLRERKEGLYTDLKTLALDNYQLFIQNYNTINHTNKNIDVISNEIGSLLDHLPDISKSCESFSKVTHSLSESRRSVKNLLDNFPTMLDLLEIPQLMDTCVKNGLYEEALQLESFAKKLSKQFPNIKIIEEIEKNFGEIRLSLISTLQQSLCGNVSLTDCIKYIGYLRKLSIYKENELKLLYLYCREQWFINNQKFINDSNPVSYLTKLADNCRTNMFDIITQFTAIFSNDSEDDGNLDDMILYSWIQQKIQAYLSILEKNLYQIKEGSSILYILENSMYFSMSLSRVGIDFRSLLQPIFEKPIFNHFQSQITISTHHFLESLKSFKFVKLPTTNTNNTNNNNSSSGIISPPMNLLNYPPLAILLNSFLQSFNELKECLPVSLVDQLISKLKETLVTIVSGVQSFYNQSSFNENQEKVFHGFCKGIVNDFIPFIVNCFAQIIQNNQTTGHQNLSSIIDVKSLTYSLTKIYSTEPLQSPLDDYDNNLPEIKKDGIKEVIKTKKDEVIEPPRETTKEQESETKKDEIKEVVVKNKGDEVTETSQETTKEQEPETKKDEIIEPTQESSKEQEPETNKDEIKEEVVKDKEDEVTEPPQETTQEQESETKKDETIEPTQETTKDQESEINKDEIKEVVVQDKVDEVTEPPLETTKEQESEIKKDEVTEPPQEPTKEQESEINKDEIKEEVVKTIEDEVIEPTQETTQETQEQELEIKKDEAKEVVVKTLEEEVIEPTQETTKEQDQIPEEDINEKEKSQEK